MRVIVRWVAALSTVVFFACGDERPKADACQADGQCEGGEVCLRQACTPIEAATLQASAEAVGAAVAVAVLDGQGSACEGGKCKRLAYGSSVTFRAPVQQGARFQSWSGSPECTGTAPELTIDNLRADVHCVANYVARLRVSGEVVGVEGGGVIASSESPHANCSGNVCEVDADTPVQLEAMMRWGERFVGWSGAGCSDGRDASPLLEVTPRAGDIACTASFQPRVSIGGKSMGVEATIEVTSTTPFAVCEPGSCLIDQGASGVLNAPEVEGYRFAGWSGTESCTGDDPRLIISNATSSELCLATYMRRFTVAGAPSGATPPPDVRAVSSDQYATCSGGACQVDNHGSVTLIAWSSPGYRLERWSGPGCGMETGAALELQDVTSDLSCTANYVPGIAVNGIVVGAPADVRASSTTPGATCTGGGCIIPMNGNVTLEAPTIEGFRFQRWKGEAGCEGTNLTLRFTAVTASKTCEAEYFTRYVARGLAAPREGGTIVASSTNVGAFCRDNACTLDAGGAVKLDATAAEGYRFSGWSGGGPCTGNRPSITVPDIKTNVSCQANFVVRASVTGVASPENAGRVQAYSDSGSAQCTGNTCTVDEGSRVDLMAVPAAGFRFANWSECSSSTSPNLRVDDVRRAVVCRANFVPLRFTVASSINPANSGSVTASSPSPSAECQGGSCMVNFGGSVRLTATPATGFRFSSWSGCGQSNAPMLVLDDVRANRTCVANFARIVISATAVPNPREGGTVRATSTSAGAQCNGTRCNVPYGGAATLTAMPTRGYRFAGWSGCGASTDLTLNLTNITTAVECQANFELTRWSVTGVANPQSAGDVVATAAGNGTCSNGRCSVDFGANVTLEARANAGYRFTGWTGCRNSNERMLRFNNVSNDISCTANYERIRVTVAATTAPMNSGSARATAMVAGAQCMGARCTVNYGETVTLTAADSDAFEFTHWSSCPITEGRTIVLADVKENITCTANFQARTFVVTGGGQGGSVMGVGAGCTDNVCTVPYGGSATFKATAAAGYRLTGWMGCRAGSDPTTATIANVTASAMCVAVFAPEITVKAEVGAGAGTGNGNKVETNCPQQPQTCTVLEGMSVRLTATAGPGFEFEGWQGTGCTPANMAMINVSVSTTCTANFRLLRRTVTAAEAPEDSGSVALTCVGSGSSTCTGTGATLMVDSGTSVRMVATPATGFTFASWSGGAACPVPAGSQNNADVTVQADANVSCRANFTKKTYLMTVAKMGQGDVSVSCGPGNSCMVDHGAAVTFTANPTTGWQFKNWSGCSIDATETLTFNSVTGPLTCTAVFEAVVLTPFTVRVLAGDGGHIAPCNMAQCEEQVPSGEDSMTFTAVAEDGFTFAGWSPGCNGSGSTIQFTNVTSNRTCTATFMMIDSGESAED